MKYLGWNEKKDEIQNFLGNDVTIEDFTDCQELWIALCELEQRDEDYEMKFSDGHDITRNDISRFYEEEKIQNKKYFMNPFTGSVDTWDGWESESNHWEGDIEEQLESLIEVVKKGDDWVEVQ